MFIFTTIQFLFPQLYVFLQLRWWRWHSVGGGTGIVASNVRVYLLHIGLHKKLLVIQFVTKLPVFCVTGWSVATLNEINPVHTFIFWFFKIDCTIVLPSVRTSGRELVSYILAFRLRFCRPLRFSVSPACPAQLILRDVITVKIVRG